MASDKELRKLAKRRVLETNTAIQRYIDQHPHLGDRDLLRDPKLRQLEAEAEMAERALKALEQRQTKQRKRGR